MLVSVSRSASEADNAHLYCDTVYVETFRQLAEKVVCGPRRWSPITWTSGRRRQDDFEQAELVVLDFDSGELTLRTAVEQFTAEGVRFLIGTTRSHGIPKDGAAPKDRFRVIMHMDSPLTHLGRYRQNMRRIIDAYPADRACGDGARVYRPCTRIVAAVNGEQLPMLPYQAPPPVDHSRFLDMRLLGKTPRWVSEVLSRDCQGGRNNTVFRVAAKLSTYGFSDADIRRIILDSPISLSDAEKELAIGSGIRCAQKGT